ncbi:hypothetical protein G7B40_001700 [Aetokthonos hydrillicola Thurmond2011]|jgi:hypothetical protein|uniref:Uncharacterized protein n=1 Tax=Aetokthonos hydrillicola Thurmond2011 TaxID=2712845 RepID=A0AAP5M313_9CYAN|nr:hypothetical protein [Aetokthonos hydrillicola]MBO3462963.1 hypothetical protein [Aetokthonos hydrillicola CCALA 1050]MBW4591259.1 hypothetical protein [Aetokthonos hydrillicola CCALA 1050]MDR9893301.1 hypothetical protein [Aetokthonos hydrillicola Thurmond2011]
MYSEYWQNYNPAQDFDGLSPTLPPLYNQQATGSTLGNGLVRAGYDPLWVYEKFGDRLRVLPADLYDAVFEAMRQGTILSNQWAENAVLFLPELLIQ